MKKTMAAILVAVLLCAVVPAFASGIDLSGMSREELIALKNEIDLAIWAGEDWEEVLVPQGVYAVGEDIPAGHWTIRAADGQWASVNWGDKLSKNGRELSYDGSFLVYETLTSKTDVTYEKGF